MNTSSHERLKNGEYRETRLHEVLFVGGPICSQKIRMESLPWTITIRVEGFSQPVSACYDLMWCTADSDRRAPLYAERAGGTDPNSTFVRRYVNDYARPSRYWDEVAY